MDRHADHVQQPQTFKVAALGGVTLWVLLLSLAVTSQFSDLHSWPSNHEGLRVPYLLDHFVEELSRGRLYPRFLPTANGGYGYPTFVFYPPAFFWSAAPIAWVTGQPIVGAYAVVVFAFFMAGLGAYLLSRMLDANVFVSLCVATLYVATPYFYVDLYVRCDLAELLAILFLPWPLILTIDSDAMPALIVRRSLLAFSVAFIILCHPLIGAPFIPVVCCVVLFGTMGSARRKAADLIAVATGIAIASPYWLPALLLQDRIAIHRAFEGAYSVNNHFVCCWQFLCSNWGFARSRIGAGDGISFQLGLPHLLPSLLGGLLNRRSRLIRTVLVLYGILLFMMIEPSSVVWDLLPPLRKLQFPWRLLGLASACQLILIASLGKALSRQTSAVQLAVGMWFLLASAMWYWPMFFVAPEFYVQADADVQRHRHRRFKDFYTYASANEFTPLTATEIYGAGPLEDRPIIEGDIGCIVVFSPNSNRSFIAAEITSDRPTTVVLNQLYFPGWAVSVDGIAVSDNDLASMCGPDGRMRISFSQAGSHRIRASYGAPPGEALAFLIAAVLAFGLFLYDARAHLYRTLRNDCSNTKQANMVSTVETNHEVAWPSRGHTTQIVHSKDP